jgi:hypothetical protein
MLLNSGCAFRQKEATRVSSFQPYAGQNINGVKAKEFLYTRVALLISDDQPPGQKGTNGDMVLHNCALGCAAAVDRRGYFLTAAHCHVHKAIDRLNRHPEPSVTICFLSCQFAPFVGESLLPLNRAGGGI